MKKLLVILFIAVITISVCPGQKPFFQSYTILKKNDPVKVNTMFQDKVGFIWFGTDKGLFKFDGLTYQVFTSLNGLPDNQVTAISQDSVGRIWTGHQNGELATVENDIVKKFESPEGHATKEISDIVFDKKGRLWFSTLDDGLYYLQDTRLYRLDDIDGMPDLFVHDLEMDDAGNIWAGTDRGVVICTFAGNNVSLKLLNNSNGLPDNIIKKIIKGGNGKMWMAAEDAGLITYDQKLNTFTKAIPVWNYGTITDVIIHGDEAYIAIAQKGLMIYDLKEAREKIYTPRTDKRLANINSLLQDKEGNIWLGCSESAIRLPAYSLEHFTIMDASEEENVSALAVDKNENIWYALNGKLFYGAVNPVAGTVTSKAWLTEKKWADSYVSSLYADSKGYIWVGFFGQGVARINPTTHQTYFFSELSTASVLSMTGSGSSVWLATLSGAIEITYEGEKYTIEYYNKSKGLSTDYIYQVFIDSKERVWFGTDGKGVDMLDASGLHHYQEGLHSKVVYGFAEDSKHTIWVNIQGEGIYEFNNSTFTPLANKENQLRENEISCLAADKFGNLVVMHDLGIDVYDVTKNKAYYIGDEIGLSNFKPNLNSVAVDGHGSLFFGTSQGVILYSPRIKSERSFPIPYIENMKVVDKKIFPDEKLTFNHNQNEITINYNGFWYQNTENLHYHYQLSGFDKNWIDSRDASATYSDLPPGEYTFHLKASDSDFYASDEATITFTINAPFWKTPLFYILVIAAFIFIGYTILKYRERRLIEEKRELEENVRERTIEIQKKNEEIQAQSEEIIGINENLENLVRSRTVELERKNKALEEYAFITAHELRAPLASILGLVNILCKVKLNEEDKVILSHLRDASEKLESIVHTITEAIEKGDQAPLRGDD